MTDLPHPYPCSHWPSFATRHEAQDFIVRYQRAGHIKRCAHADVERIARGFSARFRPHCAQDSMVVAINLGASRPVYPGQPDTHLFSGCPSDCHCFSPAWRSRWGRRLRAGWSGATMPVVGTWRAFTSLPAAVQTLLAAAVLVAVIGAVAPSLLPLIIDLIKAIK